MASSARIDELRKKFEENPRRYFAPLANEYRKAGDVEQAIAICREYLPQQPGHMSGHIVYGQALYEARQFEEGKTVFETALALDPENLIALRHLGDIALILGDTSGARTWYGRVLEADPRNEEIQAQLKSLETLETSATPAAPATPVVEMVDLDRPANSPASSAPTVVMSAMKLPVVERTIEQAAVPHPEVESLSTAPTTEIVLDEVPAPALPDAQNLAPPPPDPFPGDAVDPAPGFEATSSPTPPPAATAPPAMVELEGPLGGPAETPPIDSFTLEGLETTSMGEAAAAPPPAAPPATAPETPDIPLDLAPDAPGTPDIALEHAESTHDSPDVPLELTATPPEPPALHQDPAEPTDKTDKSDVLEIIPPPPDEEPATTPPPADEEPAAAALAPEPAVNAPAGAATSEGSPFVTETMAELYEQQGHRDEALRVYRALLDQRPGDEGLLSRIEALEGKRGPSIREVLARIASRRPVRQATPAASDAAPPADIAASAPGATPAITEAPTELMAPPAEESGVESPTEIIPTSSAPARVDALAAFLGSGEPSRESEMAATVLATAFTFDSRNGADGTPDGGGAGIPGAPARPASKDLSLDAVFGAGDAAAPKPASFSFDQFFSERATAESGGTAAGGGQESRDDVARFTQWLEGLKQR